MSLEEPFWEGLAAMAAARGESVAAVVAGIDRARHAEGNLSAAVRVAVLGSPSWMRPLIDERAAAGNASGALKLDWLWSIATERACPSWRQATLSPPGPLEAVGGPHVPVG